MEENDDLHSLLGKAKTIKPSPFFARDVLRRVRLEKRPRFWNSWPYRLGWISAATAAVLVFAFTWTAPETPELAMIQSPADFELIQDLDELLACEDDTPWIDDTSI